MYIEDIAISEGSDLTAIEVTLRTATDAAVTIDYATAGNTALSGSDFLENLGSVRIISGARIAAFTVPLNDDTIGEGDEVFTVSLTPCLEKIYHSNHSRE